MTAALPATNPALRPNLVDYEQERARFTWAKARAELDGLPGGAGLNIAYEAVDRHAGGPRADHPALRWLSRTGEVRTFTYADLKASSDAFANVLTGLGVRRGDRVFALTARIPQLYVAALGTLKAGAVFCPLFSAFGPQPIAQRLTLGDGRFLVTTPELYDRKIAAIRAAVPRLEHVLIAQGGDRLPDGPGVVDLDALLEDHGGDFTITPTDPDSMALLHFTSGTTGTPKGAIHVHEAVVSHHITGKYALDLRPDDVFWCTADPGWVTGTSYGIFSPLTFGATLIVDEGEFDAPRWYRILAEQRVTVWYTAPTAIRRLMRVPPDVPHAHDLTALRLIASVGEPLNPEAVLWAQRTLGLPIHDNWWQTETGGIMIANYAAMAIRPGSMGKPLPGVEAAILRLGTEGRPLQRDGHVEVVDDPNEEGMLALRAGWPSMFRGYLHEPDRYERCFIEGWYITGDLARCDRDGYFWFVGRADDVIKSAGHLIGPFEVESALMEHPAVAEVGVIGKPEPLMGELVKAFVALKPGHEPTDGLRRELLGFARQRLGAAVAPREIAFAEDLPKTRSGKIMRRLLKARELGLDEGDLSTLEAGS